MKINEILKIECVKDKLLRIFCEELQKNSIEGLCSSHAIVLLELGKRSKGYLKMNEITERIKRKKSTVTEIIYRLEEKKYVEKKQCSEDKRAIYIVITESGREVANKFEKIIENVEHFLFKGISKDEMWFFKRIIERFNTNLDEFNSEPNI